MVVLGDAGPDVVVSGRSYIADDYICGIGGGGDLACKPGNSGRDEEQEMPDAAFEHDGSGGMATPLTNRITG